MNKFHSTRQSRLEAYFTLQVFLQNWPVHRSPHYQMTVAKLKLGAAVNWDPGSRLERWKKTSWSWPNSSPPAAPSPLLWRCTSEQLSKQCKDWVGTPSRSCLLKSLRDAGSTHQDSQGLAPTNQLAFRRNYPLERSAGWTPGPHSPLCDLHKVHNALVFALLYFPSSPRESSPGGGDFTLCAVGLIYFHHLSFLYVSK